MRAPSTPQPPNHVASERWGKSGLADRFFPNPHRLVALWAGGGVGSRGGRTVGGGRGPRGLVWWGYGLAGVWSGGGAQGQAVSGSPPDGVEAPAAGVLAST